MAPMRRRASWTTTGHTLSMALATIGLTAAHGCADDVCLACGDPERRGIVENVELDELSGLAASILHADVLYGHNDSSDSSRIFALSTTGAHLATYELENARNDDWEDIARSPCASGNCLWVADIGDNSGTRTEYSIYLMEEPRAIEPGVHAVPADRAVFTYPDGSHDAEVLLVHPLTGAVTIVIKQEEGPASIYELPTLVPDAMLEATKVGELEPPKGSSKWSGGAVHPKATGVLLRTNTRLFHWPMRPEQTVAEALAGEGCELPLADEAQGEAVAWLGDGEGIMTIGEGVSPPINVSECGG